MPTFTRRALLGSALAACAVSARPAAAPLSYHGGRISPPLPVPDIALQLSDGRRIGLKRLLEGRATALHLMFTGCTTTCPIQGFVFRRVQDLLPDRQSRGIQLVSLSLSPLEDTPASLRAWLARYQALPGWLAASPAPSSLDAVQRLFGEGSSALADHATQVSLLNRRAELVWRTGELPSPESLAEMLGQA